MLQDETPSYAMMASILLCCGTSNVTVEVAGSIIGRNASGR